MIAEFNVYGVFVPSLMVWIAIAVALTVLMRVGLRRAGVYRLVWHPALFDLAMFVIVLGGVITPGPILDDPMNALRNFGRVTVTLAMVMVAVLVGRQIWSYYVDDPWTRDGRVRADIVAVAPDVSGPVAEVLVHDEQVVQKGDVLFRVDSARFDVALEQADAVVEARKATLDQAVSDYNRYRQLDTLSTSIQKQEQTNATLKLATASYKQAIADRNLAVLNLERTEVKASVNGTVTNVDLRPGDYVAAGKGVFALVDRDTIRVEGYFEETKLDRIRVGDKVSVQLMGTSTRLSGRVQAVAAAISDRERSASGDMLANVNPTFSWVRLAQRVPVRILLDEVPANVTLLTGRTATVTVQNGTVHHPFDLLAWR